jgi:hypothetical protein
MTAQDIVRDYFPDASAEETEYIIWGHTGWPSFWNIPKDGATPEECFKKQLQDYKEKTK